MPLGTWMVLAALSSVPTADADPFAPWVAELKAEARKKGISAKTLEALDGVQPIPQVLEFDRRQIESRLTFEQYLARVASPERVARGRQALAEHAALLTAIEQKYGVPPQVVLALWGVETYYGTVTGDFSVIGALATLAFDGRRSSFFRQELLAALTIVDKRHITAEEMKGSWAGAMGQCQFMPSTYLQYAVDFDGDDRADIWKTQADVFASSAHYLSKLKWKRDRGWGFQVQVPGGLDPKHVDLKTAHPPARWAKLGLRRADGQPLAASGEPLSLVRPGKNAGPYYLVGANFKVLLRWNRSQYFATTVGSLADAIAQPADVGAPVQARGE